MGMDQPFEGSRTAPGMALSFKRRWSVVLALPVIRTASAREMLGHLGGVVSRLTRPSHTFGGNRKSVMAERLGRERLVSGRSTTPTGSSHSSRTRQVSEVHDVPHRSLLSLQNIGTSRNTVAVSVCEPRETLTGRSSQCWQRTLITYQGSTT